MSFVGLNEELEPVIVKTVSFDEYTSDRRIETQVKDKAVVIPIGERDRLLNEEAGIDVFDTIIFFIGKRPYVNEDIIVFSDVEYTIKSYIYRMRGGFTKYMTKTKNA